MIRIILVTTYFLAGCLVGMVAKAQASASFSLEGRLSASFEGADVFVYTKQGACLDSTIVRDGHFHCTPAVIEPLPALLTLQLKTKNSSGADIILLSCELFPMAGEKILLDGAGLPGGHPGMINTTVTISGSSLQHELDEYNAYMQPNGIGPDSQMLPHRIRSFILIHPDYWISLVKFRDLVLSGSIAMLSFSLDANKQAWLQAIKDDHLDWYHASDLKFWHSEIVQAYMIPSVPKSFLIDPSGKIIATDLRGSELGAELQKILN